MISNVLRREKEGFVWEVPRTADDWHQNTTSLSRVLSTTFQMSEYQNCELTLYCRASPQYDRGFGANRNDHNVMIQQPGRWKVKSGPLHPDGRVGVHRFLGIPLTRFFRFWNRPINPRTNGFFINDSDSTTSYLRRHKHNIHQCLHPIRVLYPQIRDYQPQVDPWVIWPGIFEVEWALNGNQHRSKVNSDFRNWLLHDTTGDICLFGDGKSTFEKEEDEWIYLTDFGLDGT